MKRVKVKTHKPTKKYAELLERFASRLHQRTGAEPLFFRDITEGTLDKLSEPIGPPLELDLKAFLEDARKIVRLENKMKETIKRIKKVRHKC